MAKINDGGAAFPVVERCSACEGRGVDRNGQCDECDGIGHLHTGGMSLRAWFTGKAISPTLVQAYGSTPGILAEVACEIADAVIVKLAKDAEA